MTQISTTEKIELIKLERETVPKPSAALGGAGRGKKLRQKKPIQVGSKITSFHLGKSSTADIQVLSLTKKLFQDSQRFAHIAKNPQANRKLHCYSKCEKDGCV